MDRHVSWFSCGAASAVASKIVTDRWENTEVVYCDTMAAEHPDNQRFFDDVEEWIGQATVEDVWEQRAYMAGVAGAPCTVEMKKVPRFHFQLPDDIHTFGFTADEWKRIDRFEAGNPDMFLSWVLPEEGITKTDCYKILEDAGIALPVMYGLGYKNNNCLGCVKATSARYWNMIRRDFPDVFASRAEQSRRIGARLTRYKGKRVFIDELPVDYLAGDLEDISCGPECGTVPVEIASKQA